jgi:hypothetical protein
MTTPTTPPILPGKYPSQKRYADLITPLLISNVVMLLLGAFFAYYFLRNEPFSDVTSRAQEEFSAVRFAKTPADAEPHAEELRDMVYGVVRSSSMLLFQSSIVLLFFVVLSIFNFIWLRKLRKLAHDA